MKLKRPRLPRFGLRARSSIAFALVGLALSLVFAAVTYSRSRADQLKQREGFDVKQATLNAQFVGNALRQNADPRRALNIASGSNSRRLLWTNARWYVTDVGFSKTLRMAWRQGNGSRLPIVPILRWRFQSDGVSLRRT
jgi:hypothetical protein